LEEERARSLVSEQAVHRSRVYVPPIFALHRSIIVVVVHFNSHRVPLRVPLLLLLGAPIHRSFPHLKKAIPIIPTKLHPNQPTSTRPMLEAGAPLPAAAAAAELLKVELKLEVVADEELLLLVALAMLEVGCDPEEIELLLFAMLLVDDSAEWDGGF